MAQTVWGVVKEGVVVPNAPLPEGARVEIILPGPPAEVPPELQAEFDAWDAASARAFERVERMVQEPGDADEKG